MGRLGATARDLLVHALAVGGVGRRLADIQGAGFAVIADLVLALLGRMAAFGDRFELALEAAAYIPRAHVVVIAVRRQIRGVAAFLAIWPRLGGVGHLGALLPLVGRGHGLVALGHRAGVGRAIQVDMATAGLELVWSKAALIVETDAHLADVGRRTLRVSATRAGDLLVGALAGGEIACIHRAGLAVITQGAVLLAAAVRLGFAVRAYALCAAQVADVLGTGLAVVAVALLAAPRALGLGGIGRQASVAGRTIEGGATTVHDQPVLAGAPDTLLLAASQAIIALKARRAARHDQDLDDCPRIGVGQLQALVRGQHKAERVHPLRDVLERVGDDLLLVVGRVARDAVQGTVQVAVHGAQGVLLQQELDRDVRGPLRLDIEHLQVGRRRDGQGRIERKRLNPEPGFFGARQAKQQRSQQSDEARDCGGQHPQSLHVRGSNTGPPEPCPACRIISVSMDAYRANGEQKSGATRINNRRQSSTSGPAWRCKWSCRGSPRWGCCCRRNTSRGSWPGKPPRPAPA